jgi:hypothetical protein
VSNVNTAKIMFSMHSWTNTNITVISSWSYGLTNLSLRRNLLAGKINLTCFTSKQTKNVNNTPTILAFYKHYLFISDFNNHWQRSKYIIKIAHKFKFFNLHLETEFCLPYTHLIHWQFKLDTSCCKNYTNN